MSGKIGAKGTVSFRKVQKTWKDICISSNCGTPRKQGSLKNQHDPRFRPLPMPKIKRPNAL